MKRFYLTAAITAATLALPALPALAQTSEITIGITTTTTGPGAALGIPMVDTRAKFYIPSTYGDWITIETKIESIKRSSFEVKHNVYKGEALAIEGFETRVLVRRDPVNPDKLKSAPFPAEMVAKFTGSQVRS